MSEPVFSLLGDSNIQRAMNSTNCRDRPLMSNAQVVPCGHIGILAEALRQVRPSTNVAVLACITNFITSSTDDMSSVSNRVEPILKEFLAVLEKASAEHRERLYLVAPPMYRSFPIWYRDGVSEVLQKFSSVLSSKPGDLVNVHLLPSFPTPAFESDGVHLTPYSGLEFILHLFDSSATLIKTLKSTPEEVVIKHCESSRVLEDRMMAIEQDHRRLNKFVEDKTAEDAELADFQENIRFESHFVIAGLPRIPKCEPREWQAKAKKDVGAFLKELLGREVNIVFIKNITGKAKDSIARYQVEMESVTLSKEIRDKFGTFFPKGKDERPEAFDKISVRNRLTHESRVRINIMRVLAEHWHASNPGSKYQCIGYESRPIIRLYPPEGVKDRRIQTMTFVEAVRSLPVSFSPSELDYILKEVKPKWEGKLRSIFIVLSDDMIKRKFRGKPSGNTAEKTTGSTESTESTSGTSTETKTHNGKRVHSPVFKSSKYSKSSKGSK